MKRGRRAALGAIVLAGAAFAAPARAVNPDRFPTALVSRAVDGGIPNGPALNAAISHDERVAKVIAFESTATDLVPEDGNGPVQDIFAVARTGAYGTEGAEPWRPGPAVLVSRGRGGKPANGRSWGAAVSGWVKGAPRCIAFVSAASNLVKGDTNGQPDAFVYRWRSSIAKGTVTRVSVDSSGRQADGPTYDVAVDGDCSHVAFTADAPNLALTSTRNKHWRAARSRKPRRGVRQVYLRTLTKFEGGPKPLAGSTLLVSQRGRTPGNADSDRPRISSSIDRVVVFESKATNLGGAGTPGAYATTFDVRPLKKGAGGRYIVRTSRIDRGEAPATEPVVNERGDIAAFASGDRVYEAKRSAGRWATRAISDSHPATGPSISAAGTWILYLGDRASPRVKRGAEARARGAFLFTAADNRTTFVAFGTGGLAAPAPIEAAALSAKGNYIVLETTGMDPEGRPDNTTGRLVYVHGMGGRGPAD